MPPRAAEVFLSEGDEAIDQSAEDHRQHGELCKAQAFLQRGERNDEISQRGGGEVLGIYVFKDAAECGGEALLGVAFLA